MLGNGIVLETAGVVLDINDIGHEAVFWGTVRGEEPGPLRGEGGWATVGSLDSTTHLVLQKVPEPKVVKNRYHMCFVVPDVYEAIRQIVALGGSSVSGPRPSGGATMADPEGNEFCLSALHGTNEGKRRALC